MSTSLEIALRNIRNEILEEAAKAAEGNAPESEHGAYYEGRRDAAVKIRMLKS